MAADGLGLHGGPQSPHPLCSAAFAVLWFATMIQHAVAGVHCGGHKAPNCAACPQGNGPEWCHGDCVWRRGRCVEKNSQAARGGKKQGADYYAILGVAPNANDAAIKKAYRAKSLEYHPDKCADDKEACQAKFIEVSTAYEVLSDADKRKVYDRDGEEGLKEGAQQDQNAEAMFRQYFGREPNGKVRIVHRGGRMMFMEEGEEGPEENLYDNTDVEELTQETWNAFVNQRDEPWLVLFYKPNNDESREMAGEYKQLATTFADIVKIGAVNCRKQRDTCGQASVTDFPGLRWFPEEQNKPPDVVDEQLTAKAIGKFISNNLRDFSTILSGRHDMRSWLDSLSVPSVVLFTDKKEVPPMWKALSREYQNRVALGTVLRCDKSGVFKTELQREFDVRIPAIIQVDPLQKLGAIAETFDSQLKKKVLNLWFMKLIATGRKAGPAASFKEWTRQRQEAGDCTPTDSQFCFLWLKAGADKQVEEAMRSLAVKYRRDPIKMMWVSVELNPAVLEAFGLEHSDSSDFFLAYRSKRGRFKVHEGGLTLQELDTFVDGTLNGGPLPGKVQMQHLEL
mmetsp:Transcript_64853/g.154842  ORF Transcript_64853/g.154842 Transcript_64853/m.154842 type:complete len:566 (-) Transcript_64853:40-1737(-)